MTADSSSRSTIYARLLDCAAPWTLPADWRSACESEARVLHDPAAALGILRAEFSSSALVEAGVVIAPVSGEIQLTGGIASPGALLVPLRGSNSDPPFDVLTDARCLTGRLPVLQAFRELELDPHWESNCDSSDADATSAAGPGRSDDTASVDNEDGSDVDVQDERTDAEIHEDEEHAERRLEQVFITGRLDDAALLRGFGLVAAPAGHLAEVRRGDLRDFFAAFGARDVGTQPPALVFVDWSVVDLAANSQLPLKSIQNHFRNLDRHLQLRLAESYIWRPSAADLESLVFALEFGDHRNVRRRLWASIDAGGQPLIEHPSSLARVVTPTDDPADAARQFGDVRRRNGDRELTRRAWQNYASAYEVTFIEPLGRAAAQQRDPVDGTLLASLADTARLRHLCATQLVEQLRQSIDREGLPASASLSDDAVHRLGKLSDQMLDCTRELRRRLGPCRVIEVTPVRPRPVTPRSQHATVNVPGLRDASVVAPPLTGGRR